MRQLRLYGHDDIYLHPLISDHTGRWNGYLFNQKVDTSGRKVDTLLQPTDNQSDKKNFIMLFENKVDTSHRKVDTSAPKVDTSFHCFDYQNNGKNMTKIYVYKVAASIKNRSCLISKIFKHDGSWFRQDYMIQKP